MKLTKIKIASAAALIYLSNSNLVAQERPNVESKSKTLDVECSMSSIQQKISEVNTSLALLSNSGNTVVGIRRIAELKKNKIDLEGHFDECKYALQIDIAATMVAYEKFKKNLNK